MGVLATDFATPLVARTARLTGRPVLIADVAGTVVASSDPRLSGPVLALVRQTLSAGGRLTFAGREPYAAGMGGPGLAMAIRPQGEPVGLLVTLGAGEEIQRYGEYTRDLIELAYQRMLKTDLPQWDIRAAEALIHDLLSAAADPQREEIVLARGRLLGYNLTLPRCAVVVDLAAAAPAERRAVLKDLREVLWNSPQDLAAFMPEGTLVIVRVINAQRTPEQIRAALRAWATELVTGLGERRSGMIRAGIGGYHPGTTGLAESFREANRALLVGRRLRPDTHIHHIAEMGLGRILSAIKPDEAGAFAREVMGDLQEPELLHTVMAFFRHDLNVSEAARSLYVHRNTLLYRLELIRRITQLDPRRFEDAVLIYLALSMDRFHSQVPPHASPQTGKVPSGQA